MKNILFTILFIASFSLSASASNERQKDIRASKSFVATCPEEYLTYIDKSEGGPGAYCACPEEQISYLDKAEGGPGFYCSSF